MAKDNERLIVGVILAIAIILFFTTRTTITPSLDKGINWQEQYKQLALEEGLSQQFFEHDTIIDTSKDINLIAMDIASSSSSSKEAIFKTLDYVYYSINYISSPPGCYAETSTDVLLAGEGNCVSMTKLNVALLREMGIAARPAGGCISSNFACGVMYAVNQDRKPRYVPVDLEDEFKRGGLHEWFEVWIPGEGWVIGEATSGQIFSKSCSSYDTHDYNTDPVGMCVIQDISYIRACARF